MSWITSERPKWNEKCTNDFEIADEERSTCRMRKNETVEDKPPDDKTGLLRAVRLIMNGKETGGKCNRKRRQHLRQKALPIIRNRSTCYSTSSLLFLIYGFLAFACLPFVLGFTWKFRQNTHKDTFVICFSARRRNSRRKMKKKKSMKRTRTRNEKKKKNRTGSVHHLQITYKSLFFFFQDGSSSR